MAPDADLAFRGAASGSALNRARDRIWRDTGIDRDGSRRFQESKLASADSTEFLDPHAPEAPNGVLWRRVDALIDRSPSLADLRSHRLHLLAARRWRSLGRPVDAALAVEELSAVQRTLATDALLDALDASLDQDAIVLKGPSVAALYPDRTLRPSYDLDILVADSSSAQRALVTAGFVPVGPFPDEYYAELHHERPLAMPDRSAPSIEIHSRCNWVTWSRSPRFGDLLPLSKASDHPRLRILEPEAHALILSAHSWTETPLRRLSDLVDIAALMTGADHARAAALAQQWQIARMWNATLEVIATLFGDAPAPLSVRTWGRNLPVVRDRTVLETHLRRWLGPFWALDPRRALYASGRAVLDDLTPTPGETWQNKLKRVRLGVRSPMRSSSEHVAMLGPEAIQARHRNRDT